MTVNATNTDATALGLAMAKALARLAEFTAELSENFHKDLGLEVPKASEKSGALGAKRKRSVVDPRAPKKPKTAYMLFMEWAREQAKTKGEAALSMAKLGEEWNAMSSSAKARFVEEAEDLKESYLKEVEKYKAEGSHHDVDDDGSGHDVPPPTL